MTHSGDTTVVLVFSPVDAPDVQHAVEGGSVEEVATRLYDAWSIHGEIVVEPFTDGTTKFPNVTQVFAQELNNTYDELDAIWEDSGRIFIRDR